MKNKAANILIIVYAVIGVFSVIAGILIFCWGVFGGILGLTEEPYGGLAFIGYLFILYVVVNVIMGVWALAAIAVAVIEMGKNKKKDASLWLMISLSVCAVLIDICAISGGFKGEGIVLYFISQVYALILSIVIIIKCGINLGKKHLPEKDAEYVNVSLDVADDADNSHNAEDSQYNIF